MQLQVTEFKYHLTSGLSNSLKKLVDGLFQPNRGEYLSKGLNLLVIPQTAIRTTVNRIKHMHVLMVSQFGCSRICEDCRFDILKLK